jgi:poly(hydroxyalkanoate) depolymerase family esterase
MFTVVAPNNTVARNLPLVVLLHGCRQNPDIFIDGTRFEEIANKHKFMILAPEQPSFTNLKNCWNWFLDLQQQRGLPNEMGQVVSAVELLKTTYSLDSNRIFVAGMSAGGAFAENLTVCYPDVFSAAAIHSGVAYKTAESLSEGQDVLKLPHQKSPDYLGKQMWKCGRSVSNYRLKKVLVIHGEDDDIVPPLHAELISSSNEAWRDFFDDGQRNNSVRPIISTETSYSNGYKSTHISSRYPGFLEKRIMIKGLKHAWGGGKPGVEFFDPKAPSSNDTIINFFDLNN